MYETINSPLNYGGLTLKNRILFAPTSLGLPQEELLERMKKIAAGGCAMIIIGDVQYCPTALDHLCTPRRGWSFTRVWQMPSTHTGVSYAPSSTSPTPT